MPHGSSHIFTFLLLLGVVSPAWAAPVSFNFSERNGKKQIVFESKAPLEYIEGTADRIEGTLTIDTSRPDLGLRGSVIVPVEQMSTGNPQRDEHLRSADWMREASFPAIRFDLDSSAMGAAVNKGTGKWFVNAVGNFYMKGILKRVSIPITLTLKKEGNDNKVFIQGRFSLKLSDYSIFGPKAIRMIGVRVSDTVNINLRIVGVADKGWENLPSRRSGVR